MKETANDTRLFLSGSLAEARKRTYIINNNFSVNNARLPRLKIGVCYKLFYLYLLCIKIQ